MFFINYAEVGKTIGKYSNSPLLLTLQTHDVTARGISHETFLYVSTLANKMCIVKWVITVYLISIKIDWNSFLKIVQQKTSDFLALKCHI